jgi:ribonucleotide reductase beta subunit family protein with ferritin-like domain
LIKILQPKSTYTIDYPQAVSFARQQSEIFWLPDEIEIEKDIHDLKTNFTASEYHGIISVLKLFTIYELSVGNEYWKDYISSIFPRPDIQRMAATFSFMELGVHAPFYSRLNELLGLDTDEFYNSYLDDPILTNRMKWIGKRVEKRDTHFNRLKSIAIFSMIEGAVLYSSFAFIKHFQTQGKNKLVNINAGINFSAQDEDLHSQGGAWLYNTYLSEVLSENPNFNITELVEDIVDTSKIILEHETVIINKIFERGEIKGITAHQLINFVESRLDICLSQLNIKPIYLPKYNPIKDWFYNNLNSSVLHDFFVRQGSDYNRNWSETAFKWSGSLVNYEVS